MSGHVRGHEVGRELDAGDLERERLGEGSHQERLTQARDTFYQDVAGGQQGEDDLVDDLGLSDDRVADLLAELAEELAGPDDGTRFVAHGLPLGSGGGFFIPLRARSSTAMALRC